MSEKQTNSDSESEKELEGSFQDDDDYLVSKENLSNLLHFPSEAYNIASSTPIGTPTTSPKKSKVKQLVEKLQESETNSEKIKVVQESETNSEKIKVVKEKANMGRIARYKLMVERTKNDANDILEEAEKMRDETDEKKIKEMIADLKAIKTNTEKDMMEIKQETPEEGEMVEYVDLEWKLKEIVVRSTAAILKLKDTCEEIKPATAVAGKITKIEVPDYYGDYVRYKPWKAEFLSLTNTFDEVTRRIYLVKHLKGKAYEYVEDLIDQGGSLDALWKQLDNHFGNKHHIIDAAIKAYFELEEPEEDINKFEEFYIQSKNRGANLLDLKHKPEELLAAYFMLKIPTIYRSEIEQKLNNTKAARVDETKYTFEDLNPLIEEFIRIKKWL